MHCGQQHRIGQNQIGDLIPVDEPVGVKPEHRQCSEQGAAALLTQSQSSDPGAGGCGDRVGDRVQYLSSGGRVVADLLDAQQAPVGLEADLTAARADRSVVSRSRNCACC